MVISIASCTSVSGLEVTLSDLDAGDVTPVASSHTSPHGPESCDCVEYISGSRSCSSKRKKDCYTEVTLVVLLC